jgi:hypothetical protein
MLCAAVMQLYIAKNAVLLPINNLFASAQVVLISIHTTKVKLRFKGFVVATCLS